MHPYNVSLFVSKGVRHGNDNLTPVLSRVVVPMGYYMNLIIPKGTCNDSTIPISYAENNGLHHEVVTVNTSTHPGNMALIMRYKEMIRRSDVVVILDDQTESMRFITHTAKSTGKATYHLII